MNELCLYAFVVVNRTQYAVSLQVQDSFLWLTRLARNRWTSRMLAPKSKKTNTSLCV